MFLNAHKIKHVIARIYLLDETLQAFERHARSPVGKVVIRIRAARDGVNGRAGFTTQLKCGCCASTEEGA